MLVAGVVRLLAAGLMLPGGTPPNACALVTAEQLSAALGYPLIGGKISVYDNPQSTSASCSYSSATLSVIVMVDQQPSADAAKKQFAEEMKDSHSHDDANQKTTAVSGVGDAAYSVAGPDVQLSAVRGARIVTIAAFGGAAKSVSPDRIRALMVKALGS